MVPIGMYPAIPLLTFWEVFFQQFYCQYYLKSWRNVLIAWIHSPVITVLWNCWISFDIGKVVFFLSLSTFFHEGKCTSQGSTNWNIMPVNTGLPRIYVFFVCEKNISNKTSSFRIFSVDMFNMLKEKDQC